MIMMIKKVATFCYSLLQSKSRGTSETSIDDSAISRSAQVFFSRILLAGVPGRLQPRKRGRGDTPVRQKSFSSPVMRTDWGFMIRPSCRNTPRHTTKPSHRVTGPGRRDGISSHAGYPAWSCCARSMWKVSSGGMMMAAVLWSKLSMPSILLCLAWQVQIAATPGLGFPAGSTAACRVRSGGLVGHAAPR